MEYMKKKEKKKNVSISIFCVCLLLLLLRTDAIILSRSVVQQQRQSVILSAGFLHLIVTLLGVLVLPQPIL
jgi:hypothetical protein